MSASQDESRIEKFFRHLDVCAECRRHPKRPCAKGRALLQAANESAEELLGKVIGRKGQQP
jgi:hypothetical protein